MTAEIDKDTLEALKKGAAWYKLHREHVNGILDDYVLVCSADNRRVKPSGSNLHQPDLWLAFHWRWFFREASKWLP